MPFMLRDVGQECFMLVLQGEDIGSVFSTDDDHAQPWVVTLHNDYCRSTSVLPAPSELQATGSRASTISMSGSASQSHLARWRRSQPLRTRWIQPSCSTPGGRPHPTGKEQPRRLTGRSR